MKRERENEGDGGRQRTRYFPSFRLISVLLQQKTKHRFISEYYALWDRDRDTYNANGQIETIIVHTIDYKFVTFVKGKEGKEKENKKKSY